MNEAFKKSFLILYNKLKVLKYGMMEVRMKGTLKKTKGPDLEFINLTMEKYSSFLVYSKC